MDKVIATALLIIAAVIAVGLIVNAALPAIQRSTSAVLSGADRVDERIKTQISIVHGAYDSTEFDVYIWVKNVGASSIDAIENCDLYFGPQGDFSYINYGGGAPGDGEWIYSVEDGTEWTPESTVKFTINRDAELAPGTYYIKIITPNGVSAEDYIDI